MKKTTLRKLGISIGVFAAGLSTIIYYFDGTLAGIFANNNPLDWSVSIGASMVVAKHLGNTIGCDEEIR